MMRKRNTKCLSWLLSLAAWLVPNAVWGQRSDSFEGGNPRWQLVESDCNAQLTEHEISLLLPHSGRTCEQMEVDCGSGTLVLLAYPIEPCVALDEFQPRIWTRCSSGRIQIGVRVIFPQAEHPITQGRLNTILWGEIYRDTGQWQMLRVRELQRLLQQELITLRQRFGSELNLENAFIDSLVLNVYTGPGRYRVQVDDLDLPGMIPLAAVGMPLAANWRERWRWRQETATAEERFWAAANRPPVWLQYRGESLPWLNSLGLTGLLLNQLPSELQLGRIQDAGLGVISPPPPHPLAISAEAAPALKGWLVGAALDSRQANLVREQTRLVQQLPAELQRPLVGEALEHAWQFSRMADEVIVPTPSPVSAASMQDKLQWVAEQLQITRQRGDGWVSINTGETPAILDQFQTANSVLRPSEISQDYPANPLGLRHQVAGAVLAGARGVLFRTFQPLNIQQSAESVHVAAMRWAINDLRLWGPWIMAGQSTQAPSFNRSDYLSAAWTVADSQLILAISSAKDCQYCIPPTHASRLELGSTSPAGTQYVLRLTQGSLERVETLATPAGLQWSVENPEPIESFVLTNNPNVLSFLRKRMTDSAMQNASDQLEIVAYNLAVAADVTEARFSPRDESELARLARAEQFEQLALAQRQLDLGWRRPALQSPAGGNGDCVSREQRNSRDAL